MKRPVWLLSMDTEQFCAPPLTTGALLSYFRAHGATSESTDVTLVHFLAGEEIDSWVEHGWREQIAEAAREAPALAAIVTSATSRRAQRAMASIENVASRLYR